MSKQIDRRTFLNKAVRTAAASAAVGQLDLLANDNTSKPAATQPALEWRNKQPTMTYARLGCTNFMVSRCVFGAGGLYGRGGDTRLLEIAIEQGINYIDTGRFYSQGESTISPVVKRHRDKVWIVSKAAHIGWPDMTVKPGQDAKAARLYIDQLDESLRQLQIDTIDCYMIQGAEHDWVVTMDAIYDEFVKARKAGKVRHFGLATHTNVAEVCELAAESKRYEIVMLAANPNNLAELTPAIKKMREAGIGVVSMKTSGPITSKPKEYDKQYGDIFAGKKLSPYQKAYAYLLGRGNIDAFNAHMPNRRILAENIAAANLELTTVELDRIETQTLSETSGSCRHCGQCTRSCPNGIPVADVLRCHAYIHNYREPDMATELFETACKDRIGLCENCGTCRAVCPESIDLPKVVASLDRRRPGRYG